MKKELDFSLVLACYNEESVFNESFARILETLKLFRFSWEIILIDDESSDSTRLLIKKAVKSCRNCRALFHSKNTGRGKTVNDGIKLARGKIVGYIDIDLEVSPVYIGEMVATLLGGKAEVVVGRRIYRTNFFSILREILSRGYQWLADVLLNTGGYDTESGYKFFNRGKILPILSKTKHQGWFWDTEIMILAKRASLRIVEIPVLFFRRKDKKSSVKILRDSLDYLISLWQLRRRLKNEVLGDFV